MRGSWSNGEFHYSEEQSAETINVKYAFHSARIMLFMLYRCFLCHRRNVTGEPPDWWAWPLGLICLPIPFYMSKDGLEVFAEQRLITITATSKLDWVFVVIGEQQGVRQDDILETAVYHLNST